MAGWEVMPFDPFWEVCLCSAMENFVCDVINQPNTEEELEDSDLSDVMNARGAARK